MTDTSSPNQTPPVDLDSPFEIDKMVRAFYRDVAQDDLLGPIFNDVAQVDWSAHIPKLIQFWERALLGIRGFDGNPLGAHVKIHAIEPFTEAHFDRWLELFHATIDDRWSGPCADHALHLAHNVARVHSRYLGVPSESATLESTSFAQPT